LGHADGIKQEILLNQPRPSVVRHLVNKKKKRRERSILQQNIFFHFYVEKFKNVLRGFSLFFYIN